MANNGLDRDNKCHANIPFNTVNIKFPSLLLGAKRSPDAPRTNSKQDQDRRPRRGPSEQQSVPAKSPRHANQIPEGEAKETVLLEAFLGPSGVTFLVDGREVSHVLYESRYRFGRVIAYRLIQV